MPRRGTDPADQHGHARPPGAGSALGHHSSDPGVSPSEKMWTAPISDGSVKVDLKKGKASLNVKNVFVFDAFTVPNSLNTGHPQGRFPGIINSLRMEWTTQFTKSWTDCP